MRKFNLNILWLVLIMPFLGYSQDVLISDEGTVAKCSGNFYDSGGDSGNYTSNENYTITICPENSGQMVQLDFTWFSTQTNADILTIYNGFKTTKFKKKNIKKELNLKTNSKLLLFLGEYDLRKGHDKVLMLIKNMKVIFPKIKYISVGHGDQENNLIKLTKELDIENEVVFLKNINENLKYSLMAESNLFIMPSRIVKKSVEGFGISFVEAASFGIGSIGGKDGGASDAIIHNKTGLICDGNELNSIYETANYFFKNNNFIKFGKSAKDISQNFYWKKIVKNYIKLINS